MDPLSAIASILSCLDVALRTTSAIIILVQDTQNASTDRFLLAEEARALSKLLERLRRRVQGSNADDKWIEHRTDVLRQFHRAYEDLAKLLKVDTSTGDLKRESRFRAIRTATKWSLTKSDVYSILERITRLQQHANTLLLDDQHMILEQITKKQQEAFDKKQKLAFLNWLSPLQMTQMHQTISDRAEDGSGSWFLVSEKFKDWESGSQRLLWCWGIPGAGKTVLTSIIVNHLRRQRTEVEDSSHNTIGVAVIYLKYNDPEQSLSNLLASLLKQFIEDQEVVPDALHILYERHSDHKTSLSTDEMINALKTTIKSYSKTFIVVDGLDECDEKVRWDLIERLKLFHGTAHIIITSRYLDSICEELEEFGQIEIKAHGSDIELYIDRQIRKNRNLRRIVQKNPQMRNDIKEGVVKTADKMFLLAQLHVDALESAAGLTIRHVRNKLNTLPTSLVTTYDQAMQRIEDQQLDRKEVALKILAWVSYTFRSLSLKELQHAVAIRPGDTQLDQELIMDGSHITALCAGLVILDQRTSTVNWVHYSTKNYFEQIRSVLFSNFHASITMSCATYLTLGELRDANIWKILRDYPLAGYAAQYMADHARQHPEDALESSIIETICQLLSHPAKRKPLLALLDSLDMIRSGFYSNVEALSSHDEYALDIDTGSQAETLLDSITETSENTLQSITEEFAATQLGPSRVPEVTALHLAASMGLAKVAAMLLNETPNIDAVDETGNTALAVAMERGFEKAVEFLVNSGACVDLRDHHGQNVILLVTERDWDSVAEIVARKARETLAENDDSAQQDYVKILLAAYYGDMEGIQQVVAEARINLKGEERNVGAVALFIAVERGHAQSVASLLAVGVDVESRDFTGQTSLHRATRRKNETLMRLLLERGAAIEAKNDDGMTAFSANSRSCDQYYAKILLDAGANPNTKAHDGISQIYEAAAGGEVEYVKFLLKCGSSPSIKTRYGWTPMHWAAHNGHIEVVKLLVHAGAELSPVSDQDSTPLDMALRTNQLEVMDFLTRAGAKESRDVSCTPNATTPTEVVANLKLSKEPVDIYSIPSLAPVDLSNPPNKISLVFDTPLVESLSFGQFIYAADFPGSKDYIYHISHPLNTIIDSISIRKTKRRANMTDYPIAPEKFFPTNVLYEIIHCAPDYQDLNIHAKASSAPFGMIKMQRGWTGSWKVHYDNDGTLGLLFRTTPDWSKTQGEGNRWATDDGKLLGKSGIQAAKGGLGEVTRRIPTFTFERGLERNMEDLLVACWVAKMWSEMVVLHPEA